MTVPSRRRVPSVIQIDRTLRSRLWLVRSLFHKDAMKRP